MDSVGTTIVERLIPMVDRSKNRDLWYFHASSAVGLHYVSLEITGLCNANCSFCYVGGSRGEHMAPQLLEKCLDQITNEGIERVQISGGEPALHPRLIETISYLSAAGSVVLVATNGLCIDRTYAVQLFESGAHVGLSFETLEPCLHDELVGVRGAHTKKLAAIDALVDVGFTGEKRLDIIVKAMRTNQRGLEDLWCWALSKGIRPILDRAIPTGRCRDDEPLEGQELQRIMSRLHSMEYGDDLKVPFIANEPCNRLCHGCHVTFLGDVYPCGGLQFPELLAGNIGDIPLRDLYYQSPVLITCRNLTGKIMGSCGECENSPECMGCRAVAYSRMRDLRASDCGCWRYSPDLDDRKS